MAHIQKLKTSLFMLFLTGLTTCVFSNSTHLTVDSTTVSPIKTTTIQIPSLNTSDVCHLFFISRSEKDVKMSKECRCDDFAEEVDCSYLDITELPKLISFPKSARDVSFLGNKIQSINQDTFYNAKSVEHLDLSHNHIDFISIVAFNAFKNLKQLDLSHNKIWNIPAKSFDGLSSLRFLDLGYNDIVSLESDTFLDIPKLAELNLDSNPLQELGPKLFEHLKNLTVLNLESTMLKVIPDHLFFFSPHLKLLDLSSNQLTDVPTEALRHLGYLRVLDLSGNPINVIKEEAFIGMHGLVQLYLDRMPTLTEIDRYAFGHLQVLQELHCSYNFLLTEIDEKAFVRKTDNQKVQLSQLFLRQNSMDKLSKELLHWDENVELHMSDNPLFCDCNIDWMVHLKLKNEFQKHVRCFGPGSLQGKTLSELKNQELECGLELSEIVIIILGCVVFILIIALVIAFIIWRRSYPNYNRPRYFRVSKKKPVDVEEKVDYGI